MNAQHELAKRLLTLISKKSKRRRNVQREIVNILCDYSVQHQSKNSIADVETHIQHFIDAKRVNGLSGKTLDNYWIYLTRFAKYLNKNIGLITTNDIRGYIGVQKVADSSLQTIAHILRSFFSWLTTEEVINKNPMLKIKMHKPRWKRMRKSLSLEELERLRNACDNIREKAILAIFFSSGCRISEISGIRLSDVDFIQRSVRVMGKGGKERIVYFSVKVKLFYILSA